MDFALFEEIVGQIPRGIVVSLHRDGDPLVFPRLNDALRKLDPFIVSIVTHGEALGRRAEEIIGLADTVTVSIVQNDPDRELQLASIKEFIFKKQMTRPRLQLKFVGIIERPEEYEALGVPILNRSLHDPRGDYNYKKSQPPIPEVGICWDFLSAPTIDWRGRLYVCNRFDLSDDGLIGDLNQESLSRLWDSGRRWRMLQAHRDGRRDLANKLCASCTYYGIPTNG